MFFRVIQLNPRPRFLQTNLVFLQKLWSLAECMQVSKSLLDSAMKRPKEPQLVSIAPGAVASPEAIGQLLQYREDSLTAQLGGSMARAMKGAGPSGKYTCNWVFMVITTANHLCGFTWLQHRMCCSYLVLQCMMRCMRLSLSSS